MMDQDGTHEAYTRRAAELGVSQEQLSDLETELLERMAELMHVQWSEYMKYFFTKLVRAGDGSYRIPAQYAVNLFNLITTDYGDLPEHQKELDREEALRAIELFAEISRKYMPVTAPSGDTGTANSAATPRPDPAG